MRDLQREFALANVIRLEQNYRSHGNILDAANALIRQNRNRLGKNLWTDAGAGEPIRVFEAWSDVDEARIIGDEISALVRQGIDRDQIALLYRSNAQSRVLEHQLVSAGTAYRVHGGLRFFDRQEIRHALAYLRLITNPDDDTAFARVVNFPPRGIGARSLEALQEDVQRTPSSLHHAAAALPGKAGVALARFVALVEQLRRATQGLPLPQVVDHVIDGSGLRQHYRNEKDGRDRLENLDELINAATTFLDEEEDRRPTDETTADAGQLASFLAHASLEAGEHQAAGGESAVQLMTVHAAKGLEFDVVFITGLEQGLFPHESALQEPGGLEEERRLMYVAVTRARKRLYLSHAQTRLLHGQTRYCLPSSFVGELPGELLRRVGRRTADPGPSPAVSPSGGQSCLAGQASLRIGQNVQHPRFGLGVIVSAQGSGEETKVQINFGAHGMKWLALAQAPLTPA